MNIYYKKIKEGDPQSGVFPLGYITEYKPAHECNNACGGKGCRNVLHLTEVLPEEEFYAELALNRQKMIDFIASKVPEEVPEEENP